MARRLKLLTLFAFAHATITITCIVYAGTSAFARFDNPDAPPLFGASAADKAIALLMMPGDLIWRAWAVRNVPASVQNLVFAGNSIFWGLACAVAITVWRRRQFNRH